MEKTSKQVAAEALLILQNSKDTPKPKWTFVVPVLKNTPFVNIPPQVPVPAGPSVPIKHKRAKRAPPSNPNKRNDKGRFTKQESLFVPKPKEMKSYTRNTHTVHKKTLIKNLR